MNWTHVWRIAWKDYRRMGGLWFALLGFWVLCFALWTVSVASSEFGGGMVFPMSTGTMLAMIIATGVIYALAWAGLTFALEHEDKTYGLLRSLPISPQSVFWGKFAFGALSTILLLIAIAAFCFAYLEGVVERGFGGRYGVPPVRGWSDPVERFGLLIMLAAIPLAITVGMFWSMRLKKPFVSLTLAAVCLFFVTQLSTLAASVVVPNAWQSGALNAKAHAIGTAITISLTLCASFVLFVADWRLVAWWLPNKQTFAPMQMGMHAAPVIEKPSGFRRMLWLSLKENVWLSIGLGLLGVLLACMAGGPAILATGMLGVITFRPEHQEHRHRLLSQFGVKRSQYWFSRLWLPALLATIVASVACLMILSMRATGNSLWVRMPVWAFCAALTTFSIGQLCSMAFRSTIIATAVTLISSLLVCGWTYFWGTSLGVPAWAIYVPVVVLPLIATYLRAPRWFRETGSWKQWMIPLVPVLLLVFGVPALTGLYRVYEIPAAKPVDVSELLLPARTVEEDAQIAKFEQIASRSGEISYSASVTEIAESIGAEDIGDGVRSYPFDDQIEDIVEATQGPIAFPFKPFTIMNEEPVYKMAGLIVAKARSEMDNDAPDKAWKYYSAALRLARQRNDGHAGTYGLLVSREVEMAVYPDLVRWATHSETSEDEIVKAIGFINEIRLTQLTAEEAARGDFTRTEEALTNPVDYNELMYSDRNLAATLVSFPWERARARRLRDYSFATKADEVIDNRIESWADTTLLGNSVASANPAFFYDGDSDHKPLVEVIARGTMYQLAALAYRKEHGEYPDSMDEVEIPALPNDLFAADQRMEIVDDPVIGHYLCSPKLNRAHATTVAEQNSRIFLLPETGKWYEDGFNRRMRMKETRYPDGLRMEPMDYDAAELLNSVMNILLAPYRESGA